MREVWKKRNTILEFDAVCGGDYPVVVYQRSTTDVREGASACLVVEGGLPRPLPSSRVHAVHDPSLRVSGQTGSCKTIFNQSIWMVLSYFIDFIVRIKSWRFPLFSLSLSLGSAKLLDAKSQWNLICRCGIANVTNILLFIFIVVTSCLMLFLL